MGKVKKIIAALILLPLGIVIPLLGLESHYAPPSQAQSRDASLDTRIRSYKSQFKQKVEESQAQEIRLRCEGAQENAKNIYRRISATQKKRNTAYSKINGRLNTLVQKLDDQAYETTEIKANLTVLKEKTDSFKSNMRGYTQAMNDLSVLDCQADPVAFLAALNVARTNHSELVPLVGDIREYITNTVKPTLGKIRTQIEQGQTTGGQL